MAIFQTTKTTNNSLISSLEKLLGSENVLSSYEERYCYSVDATAINTEKKVPDVVVLPENKEQVSEIVKLANKYNISIIPRGAGTNHIGACACVRGGIVIHFSKMNKIIDIDENNFIATVQPGVVVGDLQDAVEHRGLFYPPDPSNLRVSTIGGSVALASSGPRFFKYGGTKDYVIDLEVVTSTGEIINTGSKTVKSSLGYNLTQLFVGSEGTLGIVTEVKLKLIPKPESTRLLVASFGSIKKATSVVTSIIQEKITPSTIDMIDNLTINAIEDFNPSNLLRKAEAILYIEVDGYEEVLNKHIYQIENICKNYGALDIKISQNDEELNNLWTSRRSAFSAVSRLKPDVVSEDIVVSRDKINDAIIELQEITKKYNLQISILGHIGDGNIHPNFMLDLRDETEANSLKLALNEVYKTVEKYSGSISGEHGIGTVKCEFLSNKNYLKAIKNTFDPKNILNPEKVIK